VVLGQKLRHMRTGYSIKDMRGEHFVVEFSILLLTLFSSGEPQMISYANWVLRHPLSKELAVTENNI